LLTAFSGANETIGFEKNPLSRLFSKRVPHLVGNMHEIDRNQLLIAALTDATPARPRLYPSGQDEEYVRSYRQAPYLTVSPASVWFTKQYPKEKWIGFLQKLPASRVVYLLGAPSDHALCEEIRLGVSANKEDGAPAATIINLCGRLSFLQSIALMSGAAMNYANDSAPMHFASSVNAPITAVYCSTIPGFGFGPLSDKRFIIENQQPLDCRPCGLHGFKACPRGHFHCALWITDEQLLTTVPA
jgi:heptosyltransferase-2